MLSVKEKKVCKVDCSVGCFDINVYCENGEIADITIYKDDTGHPHTVLDINITELEYLFAATRDTLLALNKHGLSDSISDIPLPEIP